MKQTYALLLVLFFCYAAKAQTQCGTDEYHAYKMAHDSSYKENYLRERAAVHAAYMNSRNNPDANLQTVYHIPVVVHVINLGEPIGVGSNISDAQIIGAINGLNDRFRALIDSTIDIGIDFCLATRDPNGCLTNGITRNNGSVVPLYSTNGMSYTNCGANETDVLNLARWPEGEYYNIYVVWSICSGASGYSMGISAVPYSGTVILASSMDYNTITLTHESGHGLGLSHTFEGESGNLCPTDVDCTQEGDWICDTPPHRSSDCGPTNPCSATGNWNNSRYNYMSYCSWRDRFTPDQKTEMLADLNYNNQILSSQGCATPLFTPFTTVVSNMSCHGVCDGSITLTELPACTPQTYMYVWSNGGTTNSITGLCAGTYSVVITNIASQTTSYTFTIVDPPVISVATSIVSAGCTANAVATVNGGTPFVSSYLCATGSSTVDIGTGTNAGQPTFFPSIYGNIYMGCRNQILILASELTAAGFVAGNINSVAYDVVSVLGTANIDGFTLKMQNTSLNSIMYMQFGSQVVMNPQNITITNGWNTHNLDFPFLWDGVSNIIIESCFNNSGTTAQNTQCYMTTTPFYSIAFDPANNGNSCDDYMNMFATTARPNVRLTQCLDSLVYHYQWSDGQTTSTATGLSPGTYTVTVTDGNGCTATSTCTVTNSDVHPIVVSATTVPSLCTADAIPTVNGGSPYLSTTLCGSGGSPVTIGTGTHLVSPTNYPAVYGNRFWGGRHQMLILGSELSAAGLVAGNISALAFDVYAVNGTSAINGFTVKMKPTASTVLTGFETGLQTVMNPQNLTVTTGWNTHNFDTPFLWDGVSNVVIEVCFNNSNYVNQNTQIYMTFTTFTSVWYDIVDNLSACSDLSNQWNTMERPNMRLTQCPDSLVYNYQWSNGQSTSTATGLTSGTYTLTATDGSGCIGTTTVNISAGSSIYAGNDTTILPMSPVTLGGSPTASGAPPFTYSWSPPTGLSSTTIANPISTVSVTTTYTLTTTDSNGCTYTDTMTVFIDSTLSVHAFKGEGNFNLFPNPTKNNLSIAANNISNGNYNISITTLLGQTVWQKEILISNHSMHEEINLFNLPDGIYFMNIRNENKLTVLRVEKTN